MKRFILLLVFCVSGFYSNGFSQNDDEDSSKAYFQIQSIHLDITTLILIYDFSVSTDFEIYKTKLQSFGLQTGYSYFLASGFGGTVYGSPFHDINLLAYSTIGYDKLFSTQLIFGFTYRTGSKPDAREYPAGGLKYGVSFNLNIIKYIRVYVKFSGFASSAELKMSAIGLGLSFGWTR